MRRFFPIFSSLFFIFFAVQPVLAQEVIKDFSVQATLSADRKLEITEKIEYDFGTSERHGIFRIIPEVYDRNGATYHLRLNFLEAQIDGAPVAWQESSEGDNQRIRLGDPEVTVTGRHVYTLSYETQRAVNDFPDHTELYWNVTGNDWPVSIERASFSLSAPGKSDHAICFTGPLGSQAADCTATITGQNALIKSTTVLGPGEGLTAVASFPPGVVRFRSTAEKVSDFIADNLWVLLPILVFIAMFVIWWKWGKEPKGRGTIIAQYESPDRLTPALMAGLMEQGISKRAITATILDLARRGFLKIEFLAPPSGHADFSLVKQREGGADLLPYEKTILEGLFSLDNEVTVDDLKGRFYTAISRAKIEAFSELRGRKLFGMNPMAVRTFWLVAAFGFAWASMFFFSQSGVLFISAIASGLVIGGFGWFMPRMTKQGAILCEECEGFKRFLSVTEKARLDFTDAPERTPEQFEKFLPAAVAFGVEEKWAKQFAGIDMQPPSYMQGPVGTWNALAFAHAIGGVHEAAAATMYQAPRSTAGGGGSGFSGGGSGGGFGGGGGGSW